MRSGRPTSRGSLARRATSAVLTLSIGLQWGCYSYAPMVSTKPTPATKTAIMINDRGRTLLADRVGAQVDRVDGSIVSLDSQNIVIDVSRVTDLRGNSTTWTGERVTIPHEAVQGFRPRKFSVLRTLLVVGAAVAAVVATLSTSFDLFGDPPIGTPPPLPGDS